MRKWFFRAFIVSVLFHLILAYFFNNKKLDHFTGQGERLVPRVFNVKNVTIDPKLLDLEDKPSSPKLAQQTPDKAPPKVIDLPPEKPSLEKLTGQVRAAPGEAQPIIMNDKPRVESAKFTDVPKTQPSASQELEKELDSVRDQLLKDQPRTSSDSILKLHDNHPNTSAGNALSGAAGVGGFSNLDSLLDSGEGLKKGTAPILMPTDVLFEFDKAELLPAATESLRKLGELIKKNPQVTFGIEGYTDSLGSTEHNLALSVARAEAVRKWLVENMGIDSSKIKTKGLGATRFLVAPHPFDMKRDSEVQAEIQNQKMNRRVEIVLTFPN